MRNHILVVDDVDLNIQVVANLLNPRGYKISFAQDGLSAIHVLQEESIDLILLDIMMPGMDGYEVCRLLKSDERTKHIPVIFLTAKSDSRSITKAFETGGVDYVTKPFNSKELLARVETHIDLQNFVNTIKNQNLKLEELNQTKDRFFSILAHDLRTPFNSLFMATDLILSEFDAMEKDQLKEIIAGLHNDARNGNSLINNLLTWSFNQRERLEFAPELLDVNKIVVANFEQLGISAKFKEIELAYEGNSKLEIYADQNMLNTMIRNLISNAIKFTHPKGKITVICEQLEDYTQLIIQDTGVGIPQDKIDKIFTIASGFTTYGTMKEKGTGLGLTLTKEFIEKHQGKIKIESIINEGTRFILSFPLQSTNAL